MSRTVGRWGRIALILGLAAIPRIWAAVWDQGIFWPDEIFQTLEQAHRFAFGYGFVPWEFQDGARSWLFPGLLGLYWKLLAALGVSGAPALVISAKLAMVALALGGIYASMRIAEKLGGAEAAVLCGALGAVFPPSIVYGSRCMNEMASGPVCAAAALLTLGRGRWKLFLAGCIASLAIHLRYQTGIVAVGLLVWLLARRRTGEAFHYAAGAALVGVAGGLLDLFTWGSLFHAFVEYVRFNLIQGRSAEFGVEPFTYYFAVFWGAVGASVLAVAVGLWESARRAPALLAIVLVYVLAHALIAHKEFRFVMPAVPLMLSLAGVGLAAFADRFQTGVAGSKSAKRKGRARGARREADARDEGRDARPTRVRAAVWALAGVLAVAMGWRTANASFDDFGEARQPFAGPQPLWHREEEANRLLWAAGARPDLCGLGLIGYGPVWTGAFSYLHRDVPMLWATPSEALASPNLGAVGLSANYVLSRAEIPLPAEYTTVESVDGAKLARRPGPCAPAPAAYSRLLPK